MDRCIGNWHIGWGSVVEVDRREEGWAVISTRQVVNYQDGSRMVAEESRIEGLLVPDEVYDQVQAWVKALRELYTTQGVLVWLAGAKESLSGRVPLDLARSEAGAARVTARLEQLITGAFA